MCNEVFFYVIRVTCSQSTCCNNFLLDIINIMRRCNTQNSTHTKMPVGRNVTVGTVSERCLNSVGTVYSDPSAQNVRESVRLKRSRSVECSVLRHVGFCDIPPARQKLAMQAASGRSCNSRNIIDLTALAKLITAQRLAAGGAQVHRDCTAGAV